MRNVSRPLATALICCLSLAACGRQPSYQELVQMSGELAQKGEFGKADRLAHQALEIIRKTVPGDSPDLIGPLNDIAALFTTLGQYAVAESLYLELLAMNETLLGREHIVVARDLNNLGAVYRAMGRYEKAEQMFQQSAEICEKVQGPNHPDVLNPLLNLAELYETQQLPDKIAAAYERILLVYERILGRDSPDLAPILEDMADFYRSAEMEGRAVELDTRAGEIRASQPSGQPSGRP